MKELCNQSAVNHSPVKMKVVSWTRKLSFSQSVSPTKTRLRKSVSSLSRLLSPGLRKERRRESKVLLPLRITLDRPGQVIVRSHRSQSSLADRAQIRLILQQRISQRIRAAGRGQPCRSRPRTSKLSRAG